MRGGIHVFTGWLINKLPENSVMYYNNVRDPTQLKDRLIQRTDTRIIPIHTKITSNAESAQYTIKSFESKPLTIDDVTIYDTTPVKIIVLRNPFNLLASSLRYQECNGECPDVWADERLLRMWKDFAIEYILRNAVTVLYDRFICDAGYRQTISERLGANIEPDELVTLGMGGGSSFGSNKEYLQRSEMYAEHPMMQVFRSDEELIELWDEVQRLSY